MRFRTGVIGWTVILQTVVMIATGCDNTRRVDGPDLLTFSRITEAQALAMGDGTLVAVLDWQFDPDGPLAETYVHPTSLVVGEAIGELKPWHGEWMAGIVHAVAPGAAIMPIKARGLEDPDYERHILTGIRLAADRGAVAVCSSMGPLTRSDALLDAVAYAEARGTIFVNVHPEVVIDASGERRLGRGSEICPLILHTGPVSVPDHPVKPDEDRDIFTWPYDLVAEYEDGWGYSNGPPQVAGTIALVRSVNPKLSNDDVRRIIVETGRPHEGFRVLDARAAVEAALAAADGS